MRQALYVDRATTTQEFVVADLAGAARFWDPLMAFLGWQAGQSDEGVLEYGNGEASLALHAGQPWDSVINEANRASPFAHVTFSLATAGELRSLGRSVAQRQGIAVDEPDEFLTDHGWRLAMVLTDPNGLQIEVSAPA